MDSLDDCSEERSYPFGPIHEWLPDVSVAENGRMIVVSRSMRELFGYGDRELIGERIERLFSPDSLERLSGSDEQPFRLQTKAYRKNKTTIHVDLHASTFHRGSSVYLVIRAMEDITPPKAEETSVAIIEERFRSAFHFAAVGMALVTVQGVLQEMNYAFCEIIGLPAQTSGALNIKSFLYPEDMDSYLEGCTRLLIGETQSCEMEKRLLHASGRLVWGALCITLVRDVDGRPLNYIIQLQDITQKKETEELLRKSDKLTIVGQLAAGVAHEVRNPLTVLKGFAQILRSGDRGNRYFELMLSEVERIESIIGEFLMLAKPQMVKFYEADLNVLTSEVASLMETKAIMSGVQIHMRPPSGPNPILCDANQIKQMLVNLMQNAIESMTSGGRLRVGLTRKEPSAVTLTVEDDGCGIPEDRLSKLGEPFYSSKEKGTGLGLMISYQIIQKHRGRVKVTSKVNEGTTFEIVFPISEKSTLLEVRQP
ncbi:PAS domain S-box protein [Paenibacillus sp.]|uniref:PAS domain S-box protein n=1 Tax=Paenibacillus sp. TaxID=58172 RepID=UPI0028122ECC|nr:PAS domain S-box protein [Paenibacillus sp.]